MRIFPALLAASALVATPCMAQVIISGPDNDAARHQYRADQQQHAAQRDAYKARVDAAQGNYVATQREQDKSIEHQENAQHQEHRAVEDSQLGR
jgi:hypothetical protein